MKRIVALAGSNSKESINKKLVHYTSKIISDVDVVHIDLNDIELPIYGVDYESEHGIPSLVYEISEIFEEADGFVISLAEHNGSYTAVFKNIMDWLSRVKMEFWNKKPMFLMATSPGGRGGATVLQTAQSSFPFMGAVIVESFTLPSFYQNFKDGNITDQALRAEHRSKAATFSQAIQLAHSKILI